MLGGRAAVGRSCGSVLAAATHGVFSGPAIDRLRASVLDKVVITNTLPMRRKIFDKLEILSVAPLIADAIKAVFEDTSVSGSLAAQIRTNFEAKTITPPGAEGGSGEGAGTSLLGAPTWRRAELGHTVSLRKNHGPDRRQSKRMAESLDHLLQLGMRTTEGAIPSVVYGMGKDPVAVSVDYVEELRAALKRPSTGQTPSLVLTSTRPEQSWSTTSSVTCSSARLATPFPSGRPRDPRQGGCARAPRRQVDCGCRRRLLIEQKMHTLLVKVKPSQIPVSIDVDISAMTVEPHAAQRTHAP
ncbi:MAG: hypothetical protein R2706_11855 [Acidimicrobiales bacterium]